MARIRKLSVDERMRYGKCRICSAPHCQWCDGEHKTPLSIKLAERYVLK